VEPVWAYAVQHAGIEENDGWTARIVFYLCVRQHPNQMRTERYCVLGHREVPASHVTIA
jgi:hypothetical protein